MYILNIAKAIKKISINEIKDFIFENYYKRTGFSKESSYYLIKRSKKRLIVARKQINRKITFIKEKQKISKTIRNNLLSTKNF